MEKTECRCNFCRADSVASLASRHRKLEKPVLDDYVLCIEPVVQSIWLVFRDEPRVNCQS